MLSTLACLNVGAAELHEFLSPHREGEMIIFSPRILTRVGVTPEIQLRHDYQANENCADPVY
jgi:hypothetical protein